MGNELRSGERIRLKRSVRGSGYLAGDQGVVLSGYQASGCGWLSYYVRMDGQDIGMWTIFAANEIERVSEQAVVINTGDGRGAKGKGSGAGEETAVPVLIPTVIPLDEIGGCESNISFSGYAGTPRHVG